MNRVSKIVATGTPLKILNVGVATGHTSTLLTKYGEVISVESDEECCVFVKEKLNIDVIHASVTNLPFKDGEFDLVCAFDVIEHVEDDILAVKELKRVCKNGGNVVVSVPALMMLWSQHDVVNQHFRRYRLSKLINLFKDNGKIIYRTYFNFILFPLIATFRILSRSFVRKASKPGSGSDFSVNAPSIISGLLYQVFLLEIGFLQVIPRFPIGVSILLCWNK